VDLTELKELLQILEEKEITEFELEEAGKKLRIRKGVVVQNHASAPGAPASSAVAPASPAAASPAPAASAPPASRAGADEDGATVVKSPIVGTFYRSPDPNSPAFVNVGDTVKVGQVLCIIEAMKLMNEIEAEVAGEVLKIHPENGQPVQYGEPLFSIRPSR
jgi:acetyl-CoA carboxylase biotin carboxyl carrier protein